MSDNGDDDQTALSRGIGQRIRDTRISTGTTQEKLGEAVGVTFQMIQKYERGACRVPSARLIAIARALSISPSYLLEGRAGLKSPQWIPLTSDEIQQQARHLQRQLEQKHPSSPNLTAARHALATWLTLVKGL